MYTTNYTHLVKTALRAGGYADDADQVLHAELLSVSVSMPASFRALVHFHEDNDLPHAVVYLQGSATGEWVADY